MRTRGGSASLLLRPHASQSDSLSTAAPPYLKSPRTHLTAQTSWHPVTRTHYCPRLVGHRTRKGERRNAERCCSNCRGPRMSERGGGVLWRRTPRACALLIREGRSRLIHPCKHIHTLSYYKNTHNEEEHGRPLLSRHAHMYTIKTHK